MGRRAAPGLGQRALLRQRRPASRQRLSRQIADGGRAAARQPAGEGGVQP